MKGVMEMSRNSKIALTAGGVALAIAAGMGLLMWLPARGSGVGTCHLGSGTSNWGWTMVILMVLIWGLVIWAITSVIREWTKPAQTQTQLQHTSAGEILRKRYAAGEISKEEYETKKHDLT